MALLRTILAALIAISVAVFPVTGDAAVPTKPVAMSMPGNADMPCCPEQDHSKGWNACALKCLNFVGVVLSTLAMTQPHLVDAIRPPFVGDALHEHLTSPPTHPPPV
jgi:hypothetical protein